MHHTATKQQLVKWRTPQFSELSCWFTRIRTHFLVNENEVKKGEKSLGKYLTHAIAKIEYPTSQTASNRTNIFCRFTLRGLRVQKQIERTTFTPKRNDRVRAFFLKWNEQRFEHVYGINLVTDNKYDDDDGNDWRRRMQIKLKIYAHKLKNVNIHSPFADHRNSVYSQIRSQRKSSAIFDAFCWHILLPSRSKLINANSFWVMTRETNSYTCVVPLRSGKTISIEITSYS